MVSTLSLLPLILILLALRVVANPVVVVEKNIMLARRFIPPGTTTIVDRDRARAQSLLKSRTQEYASAQAGTVDVPATNAVVTFTTTVDVGSTNYTLIIDTGSSNTWIGNDKPYTPGPKSRLGGNLVLLQYGSGCFLGDEWIDQVTLGHDLSISDQAIGVALYTNGFEDDTDGILGIGPVDLTVGTLFPDVNETVPTVTNNLYAQKKIGQETIGIYFPNGNEVSGELTFGGTDKTKYKGEITYTGITTQSPASRYWGIDQSITYGKLPILSFTAGIVDTGTTLILLASDAFKTYQAATEATFDNSTGLLKITKLQYDNLHDLNFYIGGQEFRLTPNAQIWPRSLNAAIGGGTGADDIYLIVGDLGTDSGAGLDFINGYAFLERFYSVYDGTDKRVGFAPTKYTNATTN